MSGFSWSKAADGDVIKLPVGYHRCTCTKVARANKEGVEYTSTDGDPQLLTVWENADGESAVSVFTLTNKAAWTLAQMLKFSGANIEKMEADNITPRHFEDIEFSKKKILGRGCWVRAKPNGKYINIDFVEESTVPVDILKQALDRVQAGSGDDIDEDEIRF